MRSEPILPSIEVSLKLNRIEVIVSVEVGNVRLDIAALLRKILYCLVGKLAGMRVMGLSKLSSPCSYRHPPNHTRGVRNISRYLR